MLVVKHTHTHTNQPLVSSVSMGVFKDLTVIWPLAVRLHKVPIQIPRSRGPTSPLQCPSMEDVIICLMVFSAEISGLENGHIIPY